MRKTSRRFPVAALIFLVLTLASQVWIFSNSLQDAKASTEQSETVMEIVKPVYEEVLPIVHVEPTENNIHHYVRKTAHFTEFALLGVLSFLTVYLFRPKKARFLFYVLPPVVCVLTAIADESIQSGVSGRSSEWADVLLDSAGAITGILIAFLASLLISALAKKAKEKKKKKKESRLAAETKSEP